MLGSEAKMTARVFGLTKSRAAAFLVGSLFAVLCFVVLNAAMAPLSKSAYCGSKCHEMKTAYLTWELSPHGSNAHGIRVECIDCHLPPKDNYFAHVLAKAYAGGKDTYMHYFGGEYDAEEIRKQVLNHMQNKRCQNCHDDLLTKPGSSAARTAHQAVSAKPAEPENRCVQCHEDVGHERQRKLFSP